MDVVFVSSPCFQQHSAYLLPLPQSIMRLVYPLPFWNVVLAVETWEADSAVYVLVVVLALVCQMYASYPALLMSVGRILDES